MKMMLPMVGMFAISKSGIDLTTTKNIQIVRFAFASGVGTVVLLLAQMYLQLISKKNDEKITVETKEPMTGKVKKEQMTISEYDMSELMKQVKQLCMQTAIMCGVHYKWGTAQPLLFQAVMIPLNLFTHPLFRIHILGEVSDAVKRPFKEDVPGFLKDMQANVEAQQAALNNGNNNETASTPKEIKEAPASSAAASKEKDTPAPAKEAKEAKVVKQSATSSGATKQRKPKSAAEKELADMMLEDD